MFDREYYKNNASKGRRWRGWRQLRASVIRANKLVRRWESWKIPAKRKYTLKFQKILSKIDSQTYLYKSRTFVSLHTPFSKQSKYLSHTIFILFSSIFLNNLTKVVNSCAESCFADRTFDDGLTRRSITFSTWSLIVAVAVGSSVVWSKTSENSSSKSGKEII